MDNKGLFKVIIEFGFDEKYIYIYANSKEEAIRDTLKGYGDSFDSVKCYLMEYAKNILHAD